MPVIDQGLFKASYNNFLTTYPKLAAYQKMFDFVFWDFLNKNINVFFNYNNKGCKIVRDDKTFEPLYLLVGAHKRTETVTFVWSVYHEYGHLLQALPTPNETITNSPAQCEREKDAWNRAEEILRSDVLFKRKR